MGWGCRGHGPLLQRHATITRQRGVALILVLWACALMAILLGGFAVLARTEALQARYQFAQTRARYAAEAGLARAVVALHAPDPAQRWREDGQPYTFTFSGATVTVKITNADGKVDVNAATPQVLAGFLHAEGLGRAAANDLAAAIADWRDADSAVRPGGAEIGAYERAGRHYGPRNGPFVSSEELQLVLGMNARLYAKLAPLVTIWSGRNVPNPAHAPAPVLAALPGMDMAAAGRYADMRRHAVRNRTLPNLPNGMTVVSGGGGNTRSIVSTAKLADGTRAVLRATIRQRMGRPGGAPYAVLQWEEGIASE